MPTTSYAYAPAATLASRVTMLGPVADPIVAPVALFRARPSELHFVNESLASTAPDPTVSLNVFVIAFPATVPLKVTVCDPGRGGGVCAGAAATTAVGDDVAFADPKELTAVTSDRIVNPTSPGPST